MQEGQERPVAYASMRLNKAQHQYCMMQRELLAVVKFVWQFRHYLLGRKFLLRTDHGSLTWLFRFKVPEGQLACWVEVMSQYDYQIQCWPGVHHGNADALSCQEMDGN